MMRWFVFFPVVFTSLLMQAQDVQWASELLRYSSQYENKQYSAEQVLGRPNALPKGGESKVAWAPKDEDGGKEFVWVKYEEPMQVRQIAIGENLNPGSITKILLQEPRGRRHTVYRNKDPQGSGMSSPGMFKHILDKKTDYKVDRVWLELNTAAVPGMQQIDCIGLSESREPVEAEINVIQYEKYDGKPENLGPRVNSRYEDRYPIISPDGEVLYFARKQSPENIGADKASRPIEIADDIYVSKRGPDGEWSEAENIGRPLNNENNNFVTAVLPDNETLVLANEYTRLADEGVSISEKKSNGEWGDPYSLRIRSMWNANMFTCYQMHVDGNVLIMAIEQDDSHGDLDIYVSFKEDGRKWSDPMNLGPDVNTAGTEGSAFLAADGVTLYFSSDGHAGYGSYDMFVTKRLDDTWKNWSTPVNLGPKINSPEPEWNYTIPASGDYAYFSSSKGGQGEGDIFRIPLPREVQPEPVALMQGKVINSLTNEPMEVNIKVRNKPNRLLAEKGNQEEEKEEVQQLDGKFGLVIPRKKEFEIEAEEPGYYPQYDKPATNEPDESQYLDFDEADVEESVKRDILDNVINEIDATMEEEGPPSTPLEKKELRELLMKKGETMVDSELDKRDDVTQSRKKELRPELKAEVESHIDEEMEGDEYVEITEDIKMVPLEEGQIIRIDNIYFRANKSYLLSESFEELDNMVDFLKKNRNIYVEIGGHTNGLPSHDFCDELSTERAKRVYEYFVEQGVSEKRLTYKGYGKRKPIADNSTLKGRKKNQRVELKIVKVE